MTTQLTFKGLYPGSLGQQVFMPSNHLATGSPWRHSITPRWSSNGTAGQDRRIGRQQIVQTTTLTEQNGDMKAFLHAC